MMHLAIKEGSTLIQKELRTVVGHSRIKMTFFDPSYVSDAPATAAKQRYPPNATEKCKSARGLPQ